LVNKLAVIGVEDFLSAAEKYPVIDVRTPSEFIAGHIPGALNVPLFSDKERSVVGTIYKQEGEEAAVIKGLDFVGPKMSDLLKQGVKAAGADKKLLVHCWRGGRRSASMAWLFSQADIECLLLEGGYKNYRNYVFEVLGQERNIIVVGGMTGSGKTEILKEIALRGEQVIDLEGLANHRGSAFGAIGMPPQPSTEYFANILFEQIRKLDTEKRLFLEDESLNIGSVFMPDIFYRKIREARVIAVMCDIDTRLPRLLEEYGKMPPSLLEDSINRIRKRLGGKEADEALKSVRENNMEKAIRIVLRYYDKTYNYGLDKRERDMVIQIETRSGDAGENASKVLDVADSFSA